MSEFPRPFKIDGLPVGGTTRTIEANQAESAALAVRFSIPAIEALSATLTIRENTGRYEVEGQAQARLLLLCGVSAEEYQHGLDIPVRAVFVAGPVSAHTEDMEIDYEWDDPEPLENAAIDLGELVAQHIVLALPTYPRKPGAGWEGPTDEAPDATQTKKSPFAVLQSLKEHKA